MCHWGNVETEPIGNWSKSMVEFPSLKDVNRDLQISLNHSDLFRELTIINIFKKKIICEKHFDPY